MYRPFVQMTSDELNVCVSMIHCVTLCKEIELQIMLKTEFVIKDMRR